VQEAGVEKEAILNMILSIKTCPAIRFRPKHHCGLHLVHSQPWKEHEERPWMPIGHEHDFREELKWNSRTACSSVEKRGKKVNRTRNNTIASA